MKTTHTMQVTNGGDTHYDGGLWHVKETEKTVTFTCVEKPFFGNIMSDRDKPTRISRLGGNRDALRDWNDGSFTVYPLRCGCPYYFEPIGEEAMQE